MNLCSVRKTPYLIGCLSLAIIVFSCQSVFGIRNLKIGDTLPVFSLSRGDGQVGEYNSQQLTGQPVVITFWRPGQKLSLEALRDLEEIFQEIGPSKFKLLAVESRQSSALEVQAALAGENISFPVLLDPQRSLYEKVGIIVSPTTLLLDDKGVLRFVAASHPRQFRQVVQARLQFLLGEIDEQTMNNQIKPTVFKIEHNLAAAWRMFNLGRKLQAEGKPDQAIAIYEKAVSQHPALTEARCALGFLKFESGDLDAAMDNFQTALVHHPDAPAARLGRAAIWARTQKDQLAEQTLLALLGQQSIAVRVRYELARVYHNRGELDKAITFYHDALAKVFPESNPVTLAQFSDHPQSISAKPTTTVPITPTPPTETSKSMKQTNTAKTSQTGQQDKAPHPVLPVSDGQYIGIKRCKKCHLQQWKSWKESKMAKTFDVLKADAASEEKQNRGLDSQKDYTTEPLCLSCHTTGFDQEDGYQVLTVGDNKAAKAAQSYAGVGCESCHGPGSKYSKIHKDIQDKERQYSLNELYDAGQYKVEEIVCVVCHNENAPCVEQEGYNFDYAERKDQGTHKHYDLKFRVK